MVIKTSSVGMNPPSLPVDSSGHKSKAQGSFFSPIKSLAKNTLVSLVRMSIGLKAKKITINTDNQLLRTLAKELFAFGKTQEDINRLIKYVETEKTFVPLNLSIQAKEAQGKRPTMEDAHFFLETAYALIFGIYDGHADDGKIAKLCADRMKREFLTELKAAQGNAPQAMQTLLDKIHQEVVTKRMQGGSTVVFCYLNKKTNMLTVCTLGDSEARLYRKNGSEIECIPLSRVLNWTTPNEARRAAEALGIPEIATVWPKVDAALAKFLRAPPGGPNLTRGIGDEYEEWLKIIIQKAKFTEFRIEPGDKIIVGCDGLWDVEQKQLIKDVLKANWDKSNLADLIVNYALNTKKSTDNVSVMIVNTTALKPR